MLDQMLWGNSLKNYAIGICIILIFIAAGRLCSLFVVKVLKKLAKKTKTVADDILINILEKPLIFTLFIVGLWRASFFITFADKGRAVYANIIDILIVLNIIWVIIKLLDAVIEHYLKPLAEKSESKLDDQLLPFARNFVKVIIILIGAIFLIKHFGYDVTSLIAGLGIGGLAFALAAQPLLSNLFGGIAIIADKPFKIGDRVKIDGKFEGVVREIGMRSTVIQTSNNTKLTIPNSTIASNVVENFSDNKAQAIRVNFNLGITYDTSNEKINDAIEIVKNIFEKNKYVLKTGQENYAVHFNEFKDFSLNIYVAYSFISKPETSGLRTAINLKIKEEFEKAGIQFAFPTQTVHVREKKNTLVLSALEQT
jgi:MscS family membrane protein